MVLFETKIAAVCQALGLSRHREAALLKELEVVHLARTESGG